MAETLPEPKSRKEQYLAKAAGMDTQIPAEPMSREEQYLNAIAQGGGGGGYVLPIASASTLGGVKVGNNLSIDADGVLSAQGGSSVTVVQQPGTSQTDVMSQNAVSSMIFADPAYRQQVRIGDSASANGNFSVAIGQGATASDTQSVALGFDTSATSPFGTTVGVSSWAHGSQSTAIGYYAHATGSESVALGANATASSDASAAIGYSSTASSTGAVSFPYCSDGGDGVVNFGPFNKSYGYNNTNYRLLTGVHDAVNAHDAVTLGQLNTLLAALDARITALEGGSAPAPAEG